MAERTEYRFFLISENIETYCSDYVFDASGYIEVYPQYDDDIHIKYEVEDDRKFMRRMFANDLTFVNIPKDGIYDYKCIKNHDCEDEITLIIKRSCDNFVGIWWQGYFGKNDGEWDDDECTFIVKPILNDNYDCLMRKGDDIYNILNVSEEHNVIANMSYYEYLTCENEEVTLQTTAVGSQRYGYLLAVGNYTFYDSGAADWKPWGGDITEDVINAANPVKTIYPDPPGPYNFAKNIQARLCLPSKAIDSGGGGNNTDDRGFVVYSSIISADLGEPDPPGPNDEHIFIITTIWFREIVWTIDIDGQATLPDASGTWGNNTQSVGYATVDGVKMHKWARRPQDNPICFPILNRWTAVNGVPLPCSWTYNTVFLPNFDETFKHNRLIEDIIDHYMIQLDCDFLYKSTFFLNDTLPAEAPADIVAYMTANPTHNYACQEINKLNHLMIAQKSDTIDSTATQQATKGMLSFNELMEILYNMFNVWWYIDSAGDFRIEHASYFAKSLGTIDLTNPIYINKYTQNLWIFRTNKYSFTKDKMPGLERWTFMEQYHQDFIGEPISYDRILSNTRIEQIEKEYRILNVTTDIMYIYRVEIVAPPPPPNLDGSISTDGFTIMQCSWDDPNFRLDNETGILSDVSLPNNHLSVANLQDRYWRHERVLILGKMNKKDEIFDSAIRTKKQIPIEFPLCCDTFDELKLIKTQIGNGEIISAKFYILTGMMEIELLYDDEC